MVAQVNYTALDRVFHRIAFSVPTIQQTAAEIEHHMYGKLVSGVEARAPVFITSLPRAGTTLLLESLRQFPEFATHSYRDMPFILAPMFWSRLSGSFHKKAELNERAHRDGMMIGYDSPEAFEEVIWLKYWPEKYDRGTISLWTQDDESAQGQRFFADHMKKIVYLRGLDRSRSQGRYLSKNNANIARLDLLGSMFPDARILIPFRDPVGHAASMLRQHVNFCALHESEPFVRRYMSDIGHFEFGELHRPIGFPGSAPDLTGLDIGTLDYWVAYWIAAFDYLAGLASNQIRFVGYESLCKNPREEFAKTVSWLGLEDQGLVDKVAESIRPLRANGEDAGRLDPDLKRRALDIHQRLLEAAETPHGH